MNENLFINLHRVMIFIRFDIYNKTNCKVIDIIVNAVNGYIDNNEMCREIIKYKPELNNQLVYGAGSKDKKLEKINKFLLSTLQDLKECIILERYDIAYDIADLLQALPEFDYCSKTIYLRNYCKVYVEPFVRKWNYKKLRDIIKEM